MFCGIKRYCNETCHLTTNPGRFQAPVTQHKRYDNRALKSQETSYFQCFGAVIPWGDNNWHPSPVFWAKAVFPCHRLPGTCKCSPKPSFVLVWSGAYLTVWSFSVTDAPMTGIPKSKTSSAKPGFIAGVINAGGKGWFGGLSGSSHQFFYVLLCYLANQLGTVV